MTPEQRLAALERGENPLVIARMRSGFAVMAPNQYLTGYCLLLASPVVPKLNDLDAAARAQFFEDMATLGDALIAETGAVRANYGIYGNVDPFVHAHVWPRYGDEPEDQRSRPPMQFPEAVREAEASRYDPTRHDALRLALRERLRQLGATLE